ncbi:MAG: DeoR/GlpR transcriptional regulator [Rhodobacteraceae bacterium]|nr:DeoR/GlpR transcriptional regulator [Paracoccaceae bacterium]
MTPRQTALIALLEAEGSQPISRLAGRLGVSDETARRDVAQLAAAGRLVRVHGAVGLAGALGEAPYARRMRENAAAKRAIAAAAAAMVADGETLMLDTGTTTAWLARALARHRRLTVVTNSTDIARLLAGGEGNRVHLAGGLLRPDSAAAFGAEALGFLARFRVGLTVISAAALDALGVLDSEADEADLARVMLEAGERRMVVADASKFSRPALARVAGYGRLTDLVTDAAPPPAIAAAMAGVGTGLHLA